MFWTPEGFQAEIDYRYEQLRRAAEPGRGRAGRRHRDRLAATLRRHSRTPTRPRHQLAAK